MLYSAFAHPTNARHWARGWGHHGQQNLTRFPPSGTYRHVLEMLRVWFQTTTIKRVVIFAGEGSCLQLVKNICEVQYREAQ